MPLPTRYILAIIESYCMKFLNKENQNQKLQKRRILVSKIGKTNVSLLVVLITLKLKLYTVPHLNGYDSTFLV